MTLAPSSTSEATRTAREGGDGQLEAKLGVEAEVVRSGDGGSSKQGGEAGGVLLSGRDRGRVGPDTSKDHDAPSGLLPRALRV